MSKKSKPRTPTIHLDFGPNAVVTRMKENPDGSLTFLGPNGKPLKVLRGAAALTYPRRKGDKTTVLVPDQGVAVGSINAVIARFSRVVAVDTNYHSNKGEVVCVTVASEVRNLSFEGSGYADLVALWGLEFRAPSSDAERIGWHQALTFFQREGWLVDGASILLVADSQLESHAKFNSRELPIIDNFFLPEGVTIGYASSDTPADSLLNRLISHSDSCANKVLAHIKNLGADGPPLLNTPGMPFQSYRLWTLR